MPIARRWRRAASISSASSRASPRRPTVRRTETTRECTDAVVVALRRRRGSAPRDAQGAASPRLPSAHHLDWKPGGRRERQLSLIHLSEPTRLLSSSYAVFCL